MHPAVAITTALAGLFTLAIIAVIFSQKATTGTVFTSAGTALSSVIGAAVSPITGANATNLGAQVATSIGNSLGNSLVNPSAIGVAGA